MVSKFDVKPFRKELAGFDGYMKLEIQKAEKRKEMVSEYIKKIKEASKIVHEKIKALKGEPGEDEVGCFEFLDKISKESRTPYEKLLEINERNKELLSYLKELQKKIDKCFGSPKVFAFRIHEAKIES